QSKPEPQQPDPLAARLVKFHRAPAPENLPDPEMLVEGLIPRRGLVAIGALPGRSKSEHAAGLAHAVASGAGDYLGRKIKEGEHLVVYVDLERYVITQRRLSMYGDDDRDGGTTKVDLHPGPLHFSRKDSVRELISDLKALEARHQEKLEL